MSKSMLTGIVAGVGIATAGGVLGYQFLGEPSVEEQGSAVIAEEEVAVALAEPAAAPAPAAAPRAAQPAAPKPAAAPAEECWDEEITVQEDPTDKHQIGGTAAGAVVGGVIAKDVSDGDSDLATAAGAAAGAFIGRKIQQRVQENRAETRTVTTIERRCGPVGTPH